MQSNLSNLSNPTHPSNSTHSGNSSDLSSSGHPSNPNDTRDATLDFGLGFTQPISALVIGGRGGVGRAMVELILRLHPENQVFSTSRRPPRSAQISQPPSSPHESGVRARITWLELDLTDEESWARASSGLDKSLTARGAALNFIFNATGLLHDQDLIPPVAPEKSLRTLNLAQMSAVFAVNTFGVGLALKHLTPLLTRHERAVFASCSARVGSIGDNRLGGWYSYRASKAAQHMLLKTAALELARSRRHLICVALHPGTVDTALSRPFTNNTPTERLFSPERSASALAQVITHLTPSQSGGVFAWDGSPIPW